MARSRRTIKASSVLLPLRRRDGTVRAHAIVDIEDSHLANYRWCLTSHGYAQRRLSVNEDPKRGVLYLHRVILGLDADDPREADHINRNRLDNRRANLRVVTRGQNAQNVPQRGLTSTHRGVTWHKPLGKWVSHGYVDGRQYHLGVFEDEEEAGRAAAAWRQQHMPYATDGMA